MNEKLKRALFWEKYRPVNLNDIILPDRIKQLVINGIHTNMLFHGTSGVGKTTLSKILISDHPHLILESKLGVDDLRTKVDKFCKEIGIGDDPTKLKVVFFEEFDRATKQLQEELKTFIEKYSTRVRFIATTNNIQKIDPAIKSRFNIIDFTLTPNEYKDIRISYKNRIQKILKNDNIKIDKNVLVDIFKKRFPDFRSIWQDIQYYSLTGINNSIENDLDDTKLFDIILNKKIDPIKVWDYLYENWSDKTETAFLLLGRTFFNYLKNNTDKQYNIPNVFIKVSEYSDLRLPNGTDPFVTLYALIFELKNILNNE